MRWPGLANRAVPTTNAAANTSSKGLKGAPTRICSPYIMELPPSLADPSLCSQKCKSQRKMSPLRCDCRMGTCWGFSGAAPRLSDSARSNLLSYGAEREVRTAYRCHCSNRSRRTALPTRKDPSYALRTLRLRQDEK